MEGYSIRSLAPKSARARRAPTEPWKGVQLTAFVAKNAHAQRPTLNRGRVFDLKHCSKKCARAAPPLNHGRDQSLAPKSARARRAPPNCALRAVIELWKGIQIQSLLQKVRARRAPTESCKGIEFKAFLPKVCARAAPPLNPGRLFNAKPCSKKCARAPRPH
jgi:hypothetical protein